MSEKQNYCNHVGKIEVHEDPVEDRIDELADLSQHWTKWRDKSHTPSGIRSAIIYLAREITAANELWRKNQPPIATWDSEKMELNINNSGKLAFQHGACDLYLSQAKAGALVTKEQRIVEDLLTRCLEAMHDEIEHLTLRTDISNFLKGDDESIAN